MKLNLIRFMVLAAVALILGSAAFAQTVSLRAVVPFNFVVGDRVYPAGEYAVKTSGNGNDLLSVAGRSTKESVMALSYTITSGMPAEHSALIFQRVGDAYFLQQVWTAGSPVGLELHQSHLETRLALNRTKPETKIVAANILH
jgi:hypothetical protein